MTRHTRNRQMDKLNKGNRDKWSNMRNQPIESMRRVEKRPKGALDPSFIWHRNFKGWGDSEKSKSFNVVEFGGDEYDYGTHFPAKTKGW